MKLYIQAFTSNKTHNFWHLTAHDSPMESDKFLIYSEVLSVIDLDLTEDYINQSLKRAIAEQKDKRIAALKAELEKEQATI